MWARELKQQIPKNKPVSGCFETQIIKQINKQTIKQITKNNFTGSMVKAVVLIRIVFVYFTSEMPSRNIDNRRLLSHFIIKLIINLKKNRACWCKLASRKHKSDSPSYICSISEEFYTNRVHYRHKWDNNTENEHSLVGFHDYFYWAAWQMVLFCVFQFKFSLLDGFFFV